MVDPAVLFLLEVQGAALRRFRVPVAPGVISVILGPLAERQLRRALAISQGDHTVLVSSPIAVTLFAISATILLAPLVTRIARRHARRKQMTTGSASLKGALHSAAR